MPLEWLSAPPAWWFSPWVLGVIGLCIGSFLNVVIHRLPLMMEHQWQRDSAEMLGVATPQGHAGEGLGIATPRSRCPSCGHPIRWHENLPVISYALLRGRCSACGTRISLRYPLIELGCGVLFAATAAHVGPQAQAWLWCGFMAALVALAGIDWDTTLLPDSINQPLLWAGLIAAGLGWTVPLSQALWGAVVGYLSLWSVYWLFKLVTGKEGMGQGDFKLLAALGAWLGVGMVLPVVLAASLLGAIVGLVMKLTGSLREGRYVPFGPFLAGAGMAVFLAGPEQVLTLLGWR